MENESPFASEPLNPLEFSGAVTTQMDADRTLILRKLREFRTLASAFNAEVPSWLPLLERLTNPACPGSVLKEDQSLLTGDPLVDRPRILNLIRDWRLMSSLFHTDTPPWINSLEAMIAPSQSEAPWHSNFSLGLSSPVPVPLPMLSAYHAGGTPAPFATPEVLPPSDSTPPIVHPSPTVIIHNTEDLNQTAPEASEESAAQTAANAENLAQTYFRKGEIYQRKRDFRRALLCFAEAVRLNPRFVAAWLERGQIYRLARKPDRAIPDFNTALEIDPNSVEGYLRRGNALMDQGRHDEAIDDYTAAIALAPDNAVGYLNRALAHAKKQDNGKVLEDASAALNFDANLAFAYLLRGAAYSNRNNHELAISDLNRAVQIEPQNALAHNERGLAFVRQGNYPQAVINYNRALTLAPTLHIARYNRALAQRLQGNHELSIAEFTTFLEHQPKVAEGYYQRGLARRAHGDLAKALQDFDTALTLRPGHGEYMAARLETQEKTAHRSEPVRSVPAGGAVAPAKPTPSVNATKPTPALNATKPTPTVNPVRSPASVNARPPATTKPPTSRGRRNPFLLPTGSAALRQMVPDKMRLFEHLGRMRLAAIAVTAVAVLALFYFASSSSNASFAEFRPPATVQAQGTVLVRGKPTAGVHVTFHPQFDIGAVKFSPNGTTNPQGQFTLGSGHPGDGTPPGEYIVTFDYPVIQSDRSTGGVEVEVDLFRGKFSDPAASKWKVVVKEGKALETFQLD